MTAKSFNVGVVYDDFMSKHFHPTEPHPECPERIQEIYKELNKRNLITKMLAIKSRDITRDELLLVHDKKYLYKLYRSFETHKTDKAINYALGEYNSVFANLNSLKCAEKAAGSTVDLVMSIVNKKIERGVAIVRPPGHHSQCSETNGFCLFNNVALASVIARNAGMKIAVVDWDIHHGQGTEQIFYKQKDLYYISVHRYDCGNFFPGTGKMSTQPNILNIPLNYTKGTDKEYIDIFEKQVTPKLQEIKPDIIIVSAGFDAGEGDPIGGYEVTPKGYRTLVKILKRSCSKICLVLEGGYNLQTLSNSMAECTEELFLE